MWPDSASPARTSGRHRREPGRRRVVDPLGAELVDGHDAALGQHERRPLGDGVDVGDSGAASGRSARRRTSRPAGRPPRSARAAPSRPCPRGCAARRRTPSRRRRSAVTTWPARASSSATVPAAAADVEHPLAPGAGLDGERRCRPVEAARDRRMAPDGGTVIGPRDQCGEVGDEVCWEVWHRRSVFARVRGTRDRSVPYGGCRARCSSPWSSRPPCSPAAAAAWRRPPGHHRDGSPPPNRRPRRATPSRTAAEETADEETSAEEPSTPEDTGATQTQEAPPEDTTVDPSTVTVDLDPFTVQADDAERPPFPAENAAGVIALAMQRPPGRVVYDVSFPQGTYVLTLANDGSERRRAPVAGHRRRLDRRERGGRHDLVVLHRAAPAARPTAARATPTATPLVTAREIALVVGSEFIRRTFGPVADLPGVGYAQDEQLGRRCPAWRRRSRARTCACARRRRASSRRSRRARRGDRHRGERRGAVESDLDAAREPQRVRRPRSPATRSA